MAGRVFCVAQVSLLLWLIHTSGLPLPMKCLPHYWAKLSETVLSAGIVHIKQQIPLSIWSLSSSEKRYTDNKQGNQINLITCQMLWRGLPAEVAFKQTSRSKGGHQAPVWRKGGSSVRTQKWLQGQQQALNDGHHPPSPGRYIKPTRRCHLTPVNTAALENKQWQRIASVGKDGERLEPLCIIGGM